MWVSMVPMELRLIFGAKLFIIFPLWTRRLLYVCRRVFVSIARMGRQVFDDAIATDNNCCARSLGDFMCALRRAPKRLEGSTQICVGGFIN